MIIKLVIIDIDYTYYDLYYKEAIKMVFMKLIKIS